LRVLDSPPERRTAVLEESCSDDPELLHEVESLLEAREEAGGFSHRISFTVISESSVPMQQ
jgi:hypothetical protein